MGVCAICGNVKRQFLSNACEHCNAEIEKKPEDRSAEFRAMHRTYAVRVGLNPTAYDAVPTQPVAAPKRPPTPSSASMAFGVGNIIIWLSIVSTVACIFAFARASVPSAAGYGTDVVWSAPVIIICVVSGFGGAVFGYLMMLLGEIVERLDRIERDGKPTAS